MMKHLCVDARQLSTAASRLVERFVDKDPPFEIFMELNDSYLKATGSDYGFIARVYKNATGPFIKTLAVTNIAWNEETRQLYAANAERGMIFENLDTLFGQVLRTGRTYISLDASSDINAGGIPSGHPELVTFLGIPIVRNEVMIGMIGLANGTDYSEEMVDELEPLLSLTAQIVYASGLEEELVPDGNYFLQPQAVINSIKSGVVSVDESGQVVSVNASAAMIFGYQPDEAIGLKLQTLIPPTGGDELYDDHGNLALDEGQCGLAFEVTAAKKVGSFFPVELTFEVVSSLHGKSYALVLRDLTEEKKTERLKNEFISIISHELRTPLTSVHSALSMLASEQYRPDDPREINELTRIAHRNCKRLVHLVGDLLDYEKLDTKKIEFQFENVAIDRIFEIAKDATQLLAEAEGIQLEFRNPSPNTSVAADPNRISQVLTNLITNAIRFSPRNQNVTVGVEELADSQRLRIYVRDRGQGISAENIRHIYEPFVQIDGHPEGAGLGLAICKRIVDSHDGRIGCDSSDSTGTVFYFDLFRYFSLTDVIPNGDIPNLGSRVLWLDADQQHFDMATQELCDNGMNLTCVPNAQVAKQQLNLQRFDLLVFSIPTALEGVVELTKQIRSHGIYQDLPIIAYYNDLPSQTKTELENLNVDCSIRKSWSVKPLQDRIRSAVGQAISP